MEIGYPLYDFWMFLGAFQFIVACTYHLQGPSFAKPMVLTTIFRPSDKQNNVYKPNARYLPFGDSLHHQFRL